MSCDRRGLRNRTLTRLSFALGLLASALAPGYAGDKWSEPFRGVRHLHRTTSNPKLSIHVAVVDLTAPGIRMAATGPDGKRATVSSFARGIKAQVAINGDFFNLDTRVPVCYAMSGGKHWPGTPDTDGCGQVAVGGARVEIVPPEADFREESWMSDVVSGHPLLLRDGDIVAHGKGSSLAQSRHPRTAVGLSRDKKTLFLLVVDGRQSHSVGMTAAEEAKVLQGLGAWTALNLDGGGSSAMYIQGAGIVNHPSDGQERLDANHFGVYARTAGAKQDPAAPQPPPPSVGKVEPAPPPTPTPSPTPGSKPDKLPPAASDGSSGSTARGTTAGGNAPVPSGSTSSGSRGTTAGGSAAVPSGDTGSESRGTTAADARLLPGLAGALTGLRAGGADPQQIRVLRRARKVAESDLEAIMRRAVAKPWTDPRVKPNELVRGPVMPVAGKVAQRFGPSNDPVMSPRPADGVMHPHFNSGVGITAPEGTPVKAFDLGRVVHVGASAGLGAHVVLVHPGGLASAYCNLADGASEPALRVGQFVNAGAAIGRVGRTGTATDSQLHFMVSRGWLIDPLTLFKQRR